MLLECVLPSRSALGCRAQQPAGRFVCYPPLLLCGSGFMWQFHVGKCPCLVFLVTGTLMASSQFLFRPVHIRLYDWNMWFPC